MTSKILKAILAVSLSIMVVCAGLVIGIMYDYMGEKMDAEMENEAALAEKIWLSDGVKGLEDVDKIIVNGSKCRITVIEPSGSVLYDNMTDASEMSNHIDREEVKDAIDTGSGRAVRTSYTMKNTTRYFALKADDGVIIRISENHYSPLRILYDTFGMVIITVALLLILSFFISRRVAAAIVKPINDMDPENPNAGGTYEELTPLIQRIKQQNIKIRRQMENLRQNREEFAVITENMSEGILILGPHGEILSYNKSSLDLLGVDVEDRKKQVLDEPALSLIDSEAFREGITKALEGKSYQAILPVGERSCRFLANPVMKGRSVSGAVVIILDVTQGENGERMRKEFTSNVSHELKTPLTSIYGVADMLTTGIVKEKDVAGFAQNIKDEASRLISLINDIIKLSLLDEGAVTEEKQVIDVLERAENVADMLSGVAKKTGVIVSVSGQHVKIEGKEHLVDEIIYNICDNAIKYNKEHGTVEITVKNIGQRCVLTVKDSGIGIKDCDKERIFERFYRVDKSRSKKTGGTGLGLSIVKHAVQYMGGEIKVESTENIGTIITVLLNTKDENPGDIS